MKTIERDLLRKLVYKGRVKIAYELVNEKKIKIQSVKTGKSYTLKIVGFIDFSKN